MPQQGPLYQDDPTIADADPLWRRIHPKHFVRDENLQQWRPSSAAFTDSSDGSPMSVVLGQEVFAADRRPESVLFGHEDHALASFTTGVARANGQGVERSPQPDEPAHGGVFGPKPKRVQRALAKSATWVIPSPG